MELYEELKKIISDDRILKIVKELNEPWTPDHTRQRYYPPYDPKNGIKNLYFTEKEFINKIQEIYKEILTAKTPN